MECRDLERLIDAYLDRELPAETAGEVDSHLSSCPKCRREHGALVAMLRPPGPATVPRDLGDQIVAAIDERAAPRTPWRRLRAVRWGAAVAASLALFFTGWASSRYWTEPARPVIERVADSPREPATVVVSPWLISSWAQAMLLRGPASPVPLFVQAVAIEELTALRAEPMPASRPRRRAVHRAWPPQQTPAEVDVSALELLLLPPLSRL